MSNFDEKKYVEMKKNEIKIFRGTDHGKIVDQIMKEKYQSIENFPFNKYKDIHILKIHNLY